MRKLIEDRRCEICKKTLSFPRRPRVAVPHGPEINNVVAADVMHFTYNNRPRLAFVLMDEVDSIISLASLQNGTAVHSYEQFVIHHISKNGTPR